MARLEKLFEALLWRSRFIVLLAVGASLASGVAMFFVATVDAFFMISHLGEYVNPALSVAERAAQRSATITHVVEIVDGYLLATILLIFSLGLYELFISDIDEAKDSKAASKVLLIESLDDLKGRLAKVILMILIVKYFEHAIGMSFRSALDLLLLAAGIALLGLALYLSHAGERHEGGRH